MSWHFSQALVAAFSQATFSDGERFAPLRSTTTRGAYCWRDRTTESLDLFQFGMTSLPSTGGLGVELLTWYRAGFPARTSASPAPCGEGSESPENAAASGVSTYESSERSGPDSFGGRTRPSSDRKDSATSWETFPASGMYVDGQLSALPMSAFRTQENVFGFSLPTPTARDWKDTPGMALERKDGKKRTDRLPMLLFSCVRSAGIEWKKTTPMDARTVSVRGLTVKIQGSEYSPELPEWLMEWPIGWTACAPLAMGRFHEWQRLHSDFSEGR
jgi:hypothetical protein